MIRLLRYIYTAYTAIVFISFLLITAPFFFLFSAILGKKSLLPVLFLCKFIAFGFGILSGIFYRFHKNKNIDKKKAYVIIANHRSNLDAPVCAAACRGPVRYLGKKELLSIPLLGQILKITIVIVDRSSAESRRKSMLRLGAYLGGGDSIFIFPEGTRNKTADQPMIEFKDGAFRIAVELQAPILPMVLINTETIMPNKKLLMRPGIVDVYYMDPVETKGLTLQDIPALKRRIKEIMISKYLEHTR
jgi:1-acyl-sn-glycerol-3-phosphate acyltransferase